MYIGKAETAAISITNSSEQVPIKVGLINLTKRFSVSPSLATTDLTALNQFSARSVTAATKKSLEASWSHMHDAIFRRSSILVYGNGSLN